MANQFRFEEMTDEQVVKIAQAGNGEALEYLLNKHKNFVRTKARSYFLIGADHDKIKKEQSEKKFMYWLSTDTNLLDSPFIKIKINSIYRLFHFLFKLVQIIAGFV